ncbi:putative beta-lysine N-acetyltransferase [Alteribacillus sp. HJP-4]|uniref:putative beta-lysine N-acetyltransferase n=1 Tax=Alteribacillus sp. HJP-4 TaxID=2775394 RepID=UPI0035CCD2FD
MQIVKDQAYELTVSEMNILLEPISRRIKIYKLPQKNKLKDFINILKEVSDIHKCDKVIFYVKKNEKEWLPSFSCSYEGRIEGFFNGEDAFIYSLFFIPSRNDATVLVKEENHILELAKQRRVVIKHAPVPTGYKMRWAHADDVKQLAALYDTVFQSYPTPMNDPQFIREMMDCDVYFLVVEKGKEIVSACSADVQTEFQAAELSDCATKEEHRKKQLLSCQVAQLIPKVKQMDLKTIFSYSRSVSLGMNLVNAKHGFKYGGRMIQNSNIAGRLENMNIWYKRL